MIRNEEFERSKNELAPSNAHNNHSTTDSSRPLQTPPVSASTASTASTASASTKAPPGVPNPSMSVSSTTDDPSSTRQQSFASEVDALFMRSNSTPLHNHQDSILQSLLKQELESQQQQQQQQQNHQHNQQGEQDRLLAQAMESSLNIPFFGSESNGPGTLQPTGRMKSNSSLNGVGSGGLNSNTHTTNSSLVSLNLENINNNINNNMTNGNNNNSVLNRSHDFQNNSNMTSNLASHLQARNVNINNNTSNMNDGHNNHNNHNHGHNHNRNQTHTTHSTNNHNQHSRTNSVSSTILSVLNAGLQDKSSSDHTSQTSHADTYFPDTNTSSMPLSLSSMKSISSFTMNHSHGGINSHHHPLGHGRSSHSHGSGLINIQSNMGNMNSMNKNNTNGNNGNIHGNVINEHIPNQSNMIMNIRKAQQQQQSMSMSTSGGISPNNNKGNNSNNNNNNNSNNNNSMNHNHNLSNAFNNLNNIDISIPRSLPPQKPLNEKAIHFAFFIPTGNVVSQNEKTMAKDILFQIQIQLYFQSDGPDHVRTVYQTQKFLSEMKAVDDSLGFLNTVKLPKLQEFEGTALPKSTLLNFETYLNDIAKFYINKEMTSQYKWNLLDFFEDDVHTLSDKIRLLMLELTFQQSCDKIQRLENELNAARNDLYSTKRLVNETKHALDETKSVLNDSNTMFAALRREIDQMKAAGSVLRQSDPTTPFAPPASPVINSVGLQYYPPSSLAANSVNSTQDGNGQSVLPDFPNMEPSVVVAFADKILSEKGPLPVGEVGKMLQEATGIAQFKQVIKEKHNGLKKFLEKYDDTFIMSNDHPFNPHVYLRRSFSAEEQRLIENGCTSFLDEFKKIKKSRRGNNTINKQKAWSSNTQSSQMGGYQHQHFS